MDKFYSILQNIELVVLLIGTEENNCSNTKDITALRSGIFWWNIDLFNVISTTKPRISTKMAIIDQWSITSTHWPPCKSIAPNLREVAWWNIFDGEYPGMTYFGKFLSKQGTWGPETQRELHSSVSSCLAGGAASCRRCTGPSPHHQSNLKGDSICFGRLFSNTQDWYTLCFLLRWSFKYMEDFTTAWHRWHCEASSRVLWASWMCRFKALGCTNLPQSSHLCFSPITKK